MIGRRAQPKTSLLIVRNEDGTLERQRVPDRDTIRVLSELGDRVLSAHDHKGNPLYSQGAWPESPAGYVADRTATEPRPQPEPAPPAVAHAMDRETPALAAPQQKVSRSTVAEPPVAQSGGSHVDHFAQGADYGSVATADPITNAEEHTGRIYAAGARMPGEGTAWDLRMPDGTTGRATAEHVVSGDWMHQTIAHAPDSDFAVVSGRQSDGDSALELASRDAQPGDQVAIVSDRGVIPANVTGTETVEPAGESNAYHSTVVDQSVKPGWSGSPMVLTTPGDPDQGKVVATATCSNSAESNGVPASVMREAIGGPSAPAEVVPADDAMAAAHQPAISR